MFPPPQHDEFQIIPLLPLQRLSRAPCPRADLPSASLQANAVLKLRVFTLSPPNQSSSELQVLKSVTGK